MEGKQKVALTFALYRSEALIRRETITQDIVKVGKDTKSHLCVDDDLAARMHAVIEVASPEDITLIDLGNEPGTIVNGARVNKCKVGPGDQIQIGGTRIVLERAEPVAVAAPAPAPAPARPAPPSPFGAAQPGNPFGAAAPASPFGAAPANPFAAAAPSNPFAAASPFGAGDPFGMSNPFAPPPPVDEVPADAPEGSYTYTLVKSGPDVPADEVEAPTASVEVMILWDQMVLNVAHLTPPRSFYVGEEEGKNFKCDYFISSEKLGTTRAPVVLADRGGPVSVVVLPRATGTVEIPGQPKITLQQAIDTGRAQPCSELSGAYQVALPSGSKARVELDGIVFQVSAVNAG
ncbi:MAG TPA: FHA domain-containing protein, partial [Bacilli bacterium]|nr:FHA domain-containing protein [Bacilli bacterium]